MTPVHRGWAADDYGGGRRSGCADGIGQIGLEPSRARMLNQPMLTIVADSNSLRHPGLKEFLAASRDHAIALSDMTLVEMRKTRALRTSRDSLLIASMFPMQVYALRRTDMMLDDNVTTERAAYDLIDYGASADLADLMCRLVTVPEPAGLRDEMTWHESNAQTVMQRLSEEVSHFEDAMLDAAKDFTQHELTQIRTMTNVPEKTSYKLLELLKTTTGQFIRANQDPTRTEPMMLREVVGMFAFRYSLCTTLHFLEWVGLGNTTGKKLTRRVNDVVDMQVVAMGTYFNGVFTLDVAQQTLSNTARGIIRRLGGYVGEDLIIKSAAVL